MASWHWSPSEWNKEINSETINCSLTMTDEKKELSFPEAIEDKYNSGQGDTESVIVFMIVPKNAADNKGELFVPRAITLDDYNITSAGDQAKIKSLCDKVTFLDLSNNNLSDWSEVLKIVANIPLCSFLSLRANPLKDHSMNPDIARSGSYPNLKKLVLTDLKLSWYCVMLLMETFPELQELHLGLNEFTEVDIETNSTFPQLTTLHLTENCLSQWKDIAILGKIFPKLEHLVLLENPLQHLPDKEEATSDFPALKSLNISNTKISSWSELEKLRNFPSLTEVKVQGLTVMKDYSENEQWFLVLAYLPNVTRTNGTPVMEAERERAERSFIRHYMNHDDKPSRYYELEAVHGKVSPLAKVNLSLNRTANVKVKYGASKFDIVMDNKWTVAELKRFLVPQVKLSARQMRLWHEETDGHVTSTEEMLCDNLYVSRYNVQDGDELLVDKKVPNQGSGDNRDCSRILFKV